MTLNHNVLLKVRHAHALQFLNDHRAILFHHAARTFPHLPRTQERRVNQRVQRLASRRRLRWVSAAWNAEVHGWIARRNALAIDVLKLQMSILGEQEVMVQQVLVLAIKSQVHHHATACRRIRPTDAALLGNAGL